MRGTLVRIQLRAKNDAVLSAMEAMGIATIADLCRMSGVTGTSMVGAIVGLKRSPIDLRTKKREWLPCVRAIARTLGSTPEKLFPRAIQQVRLNPDVRPEFKMSVDRAGRFRMVQEVPIRTLLITESKQ